MLSQEDFLLAMKIITLHHSSKIEVNRVAGETVKENSQNVRLEIIDCVPAVINRLKEAKFTLKMTNGRLSVDKY